MLTFIDLFAGMGGIRLGLEQAAADLGVEVKCLFTSEIKPHAQSVLRQNHPNEEIHGDITQIESSVIPNFDILLGGFPCQAFSSAGKREGFVDTRGTLFFEIERILRDKAPRGFLLENVEGLISHDKAAPSDSIGRTLTTILERLKALNYKVTWGVLSATDFGVPQERRRIYIIGTKNQQPQLPQRKETKPQLSEVLEKGLPTEKSDFILKLLAHFSPSELYGRSFKDKRGGTDNIHSWDIGMKGEVSPRQKCLLEQMLRERRKKKWAIEYGIEWMDGMTLSLEQIGTFANYPELESDLDSLVTMGYIKREYPKRLVREMTDAGERKYRKQDPSLPLGYNIVSGKLSFPISKVLDPKSIAPTLVAMDMNKLYVIDNGGLRPLSLREGLRLSGYPDSYQMEVSTRLGYDLIGNTVVVPVIRAVAKELIKAL